MHLSEFFHAAATFRDGFPSEMMSQDFRADIKRCQTLAESSFKGLLSLAAGGLVAVFKSTASAEETAGGDAQNADHCLAVQKALHDLESFKSIFTSMTTVLGSCALLSTVEQELHFRHFCQVSSKWIDLRIGHIKHHSDLEAQALEDLFEVRILGRDNQFLKLLGSRESRRIASPRTLGWAPPFRRFQARLREQVFFVATISPMGSQQVHPQNCADAERVDIGLDRYKLPQVTPESLNFRY